MKDILKRLISRDSGTTHWEGCEEDHILCAAAQEIISLRSRIAELEADVVWAVRHGIVTNSNPCSADILRAVRGARRGE
jgi:hypothetical protein